MSLTGRLLFHPVITCPYHQPFSVLYNAYHSTSFSDLFIPYLVSSAKHVGSINNHYKYFSFIVDHLQSALDYLRTNITFTFRFEWFRFHRERRQYNHVKSHYSLKLILQTATLAKHQEDPTWDADQLINRTVHKNKYVSQNMENIYQKCSL
jgi:hypothetical protein